MPVRVFLSLEDYRPCLGPDLLTRQPWEGSLFDLVKGILDALADLTNYTFLHLKL